MFDAENAKASELWRSGRYEQALDAYRRAASVAPSDNEKAAALIGQVQCLEVLGRRAEARAALQTARQLLNEDKETLGYLLYLEAWLDGLDDKKTEALRKLDSITEQYGDLLTAPELQDLYELVQMARAARLQDLGRPFEALPIFVESEGFSASNKPQDHDVRMAYCLAKCGNSTRAHDIIRQLLSAKLSIRDETTVRCYSGLISVAEGGHREVLKEFQFCETHLDDYVLSIPDLMASLSYCSERLGLMDDAIRYRRAAQK